MGVLAFIDFMKKNCWNFGIFKKKIFPSLYFILSLTFTSDLTTALSSLKPLHRKDECVYHALEVRSAWALNNYHRFFKLYRCAPKMSGYLMDWFVERVRKSALKTIVKSYVFQYFAFHFQLYHVLLQFTVILFHLILVPFFKISFSMRND